MTTYDHTRPVAGTNAFGGLFATFSSLIAAVAAWNDVRATRKALSKLTDRELDDIGLTRADLDYLA